MSSHFLNDLLASFSRHSERQAFVYRGQTITHGELEARAGRCAAWLQGLGVGPGDRVALSGTDKLAFLVAHLGTLLAGGVSLPLNPRFTRDELRYFLADSSPTVAVMGDGPRAIAEELRPTIPGLRAVVSDAAAAEAPAAQPRPVTVSADDPCLLFYSSGTTGWPKGIVHTHASAATGLGALRDCWRLGPDDVVVNVLPLFHVHGLSIATHQCLLAGGCQLTEDAFDPRRALDLVGRATVFMAVPTIYYRLLEEPDFRQAARSWQSVRLFTCGSAPVRAEVLPELESILGRPVINRYGMTEAHVITSLPLDGPWPQGSVGTPLVGIELRVSGEDGRPAAPGEVGSVWLRGPNLFREYWRKPDATRAALATGWFETGDLGSRDAAGFLTLVGRKNDLIITNGFNVYPQVVERVINDCPGVRESAVLGVPDPRRGERVVAVVVRGGDLDEARLRAWWDERLVDYQRPREVVFVDSLPRNAMGKVLRRELRDRLAPKG
ncbi:MAG TPA: AMP-binding protein [Gemmataceae bacterium]|nr:AMP-binding protein [Gemmataceae bacterium]